MTTENISVPGEDDEVDLTADELAAELGRIGAAARRRGSALSDQAKALDRQRENARLGARVVERKFLDDSEVLAEEARQLAWILGSAEQPVASAPVREEHPAPTVQRVPEPEPVVVTVTPPVLPVQPTPTTPVEPIVDDVMPPEEAPTPTRRISFVERAHPRNWGWVAWLWALLGLVIAVFVWSIWPEWPGHNVENDALQRIVNVMWFVGHVLVGFFGFGLIGHYIEDHNGE